jgi:hypothetical protein
VWKFKQLCHCDHSELDTCSYDLFSPSDRYDHFILYRLRKGLKITDLRKLYGISRSCRDPGLRIIVSRLRAGRPRNRGLMPGNGNKILLFYRTSRPRLNVHRRVSSCLIGTGILSLGIKRPGREADHSPHPVPRLKTSVATFTLATPMCLRGLHKDI